MKKMIAGRHETGIRLALLLLVSILVYLPRINQIGYLNDDWYLMYSAHAYGPQVFTDIFSVDRPVRALVMIPAYNVFGDNPLYYNLSAYLFRVIASIGFFWALQLLWPGLRTVTFLAALLFLIYPGFLSQINGIDYQSQMVSLAAAMLSIVLSLKSSLAQKPFAKWIAFLPAVLLGWFYLGLVEYFIGLELFRFASLYLLERRTHDLWRSRISSSVRTWAPNLIIPAIFLIWRLFFFESERGATDIGSQLGQFKELPVATGMWWLARLLFNTFNVTFLAWGMPFYQLLPNISRLRDLFVASAAAGISILLLYWFIQRFDDSPAPEPKPPNWQVEALLLGLLTAFAGLVPVILVNRQADFGDFSRYTLASSPGSALILVSLLFSLSSRMIRWSLFSLLLAAALFTHHANAIRLANETTSMREFWWQVSWRIPQLKTGTTLVANYPVGAIQEDYFVWGPANLVYYPKGVASDEIRTAVSATVLNKHSLLKILSNGSQEKDNRRSIRTVTDYQNILVLSKPTLGSCVQVINGAQPEVSQFEEERVMLIAPYSEIDHIDFNSEAHLPPEIVFGPEPAHDWCYYYEKADLSRQRDDWDQVRRLGNDVLEKKISPQDDIEWMPFLQAYARAGDVDRLDQIRRLMKNADLYVARQACQNVGGMSGLSTQVLEVIKSFCAE